MHKLPILKAYDSVEIIAPASRGSDKLIAKQKELFESWQLNCIVAKDIFGDDLLCANTDEIRFKLLKNALENPETKAVICGNGGYGSMRLIPALTKLTPQSSAKLFVGMSDITALNLFLQQKWHWPTLHSAPAPDKFSPESIKALKAILFAEITQIEFVGIPFNELAEKNISIDATLTGGNLSLVQAGIGTVWQMDCHNKIVFLEEIAERGYRIDRMLEHLRQANIFKDAHAIIFGDFVGGNEPNGSSLVEPVLKRFAEECKIPVLQIKGVGHGYINYPLPLGTSAKLQLGNSIKLVCYR